MLLFVSCILIGSSFLATADEAVLKKRVAGLTRKVIMTGHQVSSMGITGVMTIQKPVRKEVPGNKYKVDYEWRQEPSVDGVLRKAQGAKAGTHVDMTGRPYGGRDFATTVISWSGKAWPMGKIQYQTTQGLLRTCPLWTASEEEALAFYRKHGFTQAAMDAVLKSY